MSKMHTGQNSSIFAQPRGSAGDIEGLFKQKWENVKINNNTIIYDSTFYELGVTTDAIQLTTSPPFQNIEIRDNYIKNPQRAAIVYTARDFDDSFKVENLNIINNIIDNDYINTTAQSFVYIQTPTLTNINNLLVRDNTTNGLQHSMYFDGVISENLKVIGNNFNATGTREILQIGNVPSFNVLEFSRNFFKKPIDIGGSFSAIATKPKWDISNRFESEADVNTTVGLSNPEGTRIDFPISIQTPASFGNTFKVKGNAYQNITGNFNNSSYNGATGYALYCQINSANISGNAIGLIGISNSSAPIRNIGVTGYAIGATNNIDLLLGTTGFTGSGQFGIYQIDKAKNYFSGSIGIGTTSPDAKLDVEVDPSTIGQLKYFANIAAIPVTLELGERIKIEDTGAEYFVQNTTVAGFNSGLADGVAVVDLTGGKYAVLQGVDNSYNVNLFGAIPDDGLSDQVAFNKAIDLGKNIFIGKGTYNLDSLPLIDSLIIKGVGIDKSILKFATSDSCLYRSGFENGSQVVDMRLQGFSIVNQAGLGGTAMLLRSVSRSFFKEIKIDFFRSSSDNGMGIVAVNSADGNFSFNDFEDIYLQNTDTCLLIDSENGTYSSGYSNFRSIVFNPENVGLILRSTQTNGGIENNFVNLKFQGGIDGIILGANAFRNYFNGLNFDGLSGEEFTIDPTSQGNYGFLPNLSTLIDNHTTGVANNFMTTSWITGMHTPKTIFSNANGEKELKLNASGNNSTLLQLENDGGGSWSLQTQASATPFLSIANTQGQSMRYSHNNTIVFPEYGLGNVTGGSISQVAVFATDGNLKEWPLAALSNDTYSPQTNTGVDLVSAVTVLGAKLNIDGLTADPSPVTSTTYAVIQTGAFSPKKILIDDLFTKGMDAYNDSLEVVEAATPQAQLAKNFGLE